MKSNASLKEEFALRSGSEVGSTDPRHQNLRAKKPQEHEGAGRRWIVPVRSPVDEPPLLSLFANLKRVIRRNTGLILTIILLTSGVAAVGVSRMKTYYTATSSVILDQRDTRALDTNPQQRNNFPPLNPDGEVELLKSSNVALRVVQRLRLMDDPEFVPPPGQLSKLMATVRSFFPIETGKGAANVLPTGAISPSDSPEATANADVGGGAGAMPTPLSGRTIVALRNLSSQVEIRRLGLSDIIAIKASSLSPVRAAQIANTYAEAYLEEQVAPKILGISRAERALSRQLEELDRELKRSEAQIGLRQIYQDAQIRLQAVSQQRYAVTPDSRIGSLAQTSGGSSGAGLPLVKITGMFGSILASVVLALGVAYFRDLHMRRVQTEEELEQLSGVPTLASIPSPGLFQRFKLQKQADHIVERPTSSYSDAVRKLYFNLQFMTNDEMRIGTVLVTSTERGEGKTSLALSVARIAARAGAKTLVVDCDLNSPGLSHLLGLGSQPGFVDLLAEACDEKAVVHDDPKSACKVIPSGRIGELAPEWLLEPSRVQAVTERLKEEFDLVILDSAPVEQNSSLFVLASTSDMAIYVVRAGWSSPADIQSSIRQLQRIGGAEIFTALNFVLK